MEMKNLQSANARAVREPTLETKEIWYSPKGLSRLSRLRVVAEAEIGRAIMKHHVEGLVG